MNDSRIYLSLVQQSGFEAEYVSKALATNWINSGGPNVDEFELKLQEYLQEDLFVTALNSGTSAIHLALVLLGVKKTRTSPTTRPKPTPRPATTAPRAAP